MLSELVQPFGICLKTTRKAKFAKHHNKNVRLKSSINFILLFKTHHREKLLISAAADLSFVFFKTFLFFCIRIIVYT